MKNATRYKEKVINVVSDIIDELEPIIKKAGNSFIHFAKELSEEKLEELLNKGKNKVKSKLKKGENNASKKE